MQSPSLKTSSRLDLVISLSKSGMPTQVTSCVHSNFIITEGGSPFVSISVLSIPVLISTRIASIDFQYPYILTGSSDRHLRLVNMLNPKQGWSTSPEYQYDLPISLFPSLSPASIAFSGSRLMCQCCGSENVHLVPTGVQGPCVHSDLVRSVVLGDHFVVSGSYDLSIKVF